MIKEGIPSYSSIYEEYYQNFRVLYEQMSDEEEL